MEETKGKVKQGPAKKSNRRRRRRPRRKKNNNTSSAAVANNSGKVVEFQGYLWKKDQGQTIVVEEDNGFSPGRLSAVVPDELLAELNLDSGLYVEGKAIQRDRCRVTEVTSIEGMPPEEYQQRMVPFANLISIDPDERFKLETETQVVEPRVAELVAPLGRGQRCLIVSPPKAGKTTLLQQMAHAISVNHPEVEIFILLVDERPEEVTDWRRRLLSGKVYASSSDQSIESHIRISEVVSERARRLVEMGRDVVIFLDSLTRMARAYNNAQKGSGKILSGGVDARTMEKPRRFFGAARNAEGGGSLTIVATCLIDTGSRMDEVIFQEFKGTGNMELVLSRKLFERRIFPCINIPESGTRKEEKLYPKEQVEKLHLMRRALSSLSPEAAMELLLKKVREFPSNERFLSSLQLA